MMCGCKNQLMKNVYETGFALDEILLYLDTHPTDQEAMNYYHYVKQLNKEAVCAYEQAYGPLMINRYHRIIGVDKSPWPWEGGNA